MYNQEQKLRYIDSAKSRNVNIEKYLKNAFECTQNNEERLNKDISEFTALEIIDYYKSKLTPSFETLNVLHSQLSLYTAYCLSQNLLTDSQNHFQEISIDIIHDCVNIGLQQSKIISREDLLYLTHVNQNDMLNISDACLLLALFEGICGKNMCDLLRLKYEDVDENNELHLVNDKKQTYAIKISDELKNMMYLSSQEYTYYTEGKERQIRSYQFDPSSNKVFKPLVTSPNDTSFLFLQHKLARVVKRLDCAFTAHNLMESGRIHMINEYMRAEGTTVAATLKKHPEISQIYGNLNSIPMFIKKYENFLYRAE